MHKQLLNEAFKKAKKELGSDRITHLSKHLSDYIIEDSKEPYGERILRDNYNKILENSNDKIYLRGYAAESLSHYLGFTSFIDFIKSFPEDKKDFNLKSLKISKKKKLVALLVVVFLAGLFIYHSATKQRWMIWQKDHYVEVDFDAKTYKINQLKLLKEDRLKNFKKITPTCNQTLFFNEDGSINLWYGKNKNKELEYFTDLGRHPETGKTLKPITQYMIDKYICK